MDDTIDDLHRRKRDLLSNHNQKLHRIFSNPSQVTFEICLTRSGYLSQKPCTSSKPLQDLLPIQCASLTPGGVHYNRVLRGTIIARPYVMNAAHTLIEDEGGSVVSVSFYNFVPDSVGFPQNQHVAKSRFSPGTKIAIAEPYYKFGLDGSQFVRVDDVAKDVIFLKQLGPRGSAGWRREGEALFEEQHFDEAIFSYTRSIDTHVESQLAAILLSNIASALLMKQDLVIGLLFSVASWVVDGSRFRPYYTAGFILSKLNRRDLAFNCLEHCRKLKAPANLIHQLVVQLRRGPRVHVPASKWNDDVLDIVASGNVDQLLNMKTDDAANSLELKERGNKLFKKKKYDQCIHDYCTALRGISEVATLLNSRAICYSRLGNHAQAAFNASAAILVTPSHTKAHYWKAMSLLQLDHKHEAQACCKTALAIVGDNPNLQELSERVRLSLEHPGTQAPYPGLQRRLSEREHEEMLRFGTATASDMAEFNRKIEFLSMIADGSPRNMMRILGLQVDTRVSPFHLEFFHEGKWPLGCDMRSAMELLMSAYEHARAPDSLLLKNLANQTEPEPADLCKRLHSASPNIVQWWCRAPLGSLSPRVRLPYQANLLHSFASCSRGERSLILGTVHIAVGFNDLNELLFSRFVHCAQYKGPLRWIGYERSAYSVAKAMVIAQMIRQQEDTNCILQVWYSSAWTEKTLSSFRKALRDLLDSTKAVDVVPYAVNVVSLWRHWHHSDVSLRTARSEWLCRHSYRNHVELANFRRRMDRVALCSYLISGEVLDGTHGSVVMFGLPTQTVEEQFDFYLDEWFLRCLSLYEILDECDSQTNIVDAAIRILQKQISQLKERVQKGSVEIEVRCKPVTPNDEQTHLEIRKLSPHSMSWSNLCDYCPTEAFHAMVRACSGKDTIHYLYSMNWSTEVKGAHLMDYIPEQHREMLDDCNEAIAAAYQVRGVIEYLHVPPITHAYNLAHHFLGFTTHEVWTDNFFTAANLDRREKQVAEIKQAAFNVLGRGQGTIYMVFTFNPNISLEHLSDAMSSASL